MKIDEQLLVNYMHNFVGFGSYNADYWFVGMEQGGGQGLEELSRRLEAWKTAGLGEVVDFHPYVEAMGDLRWHGPKARIQPTLAKMVRVVLAAQGADASPETVRAYQGLRLARSQGETLVTELFPLPSQSVSHWICSDFSTLPYSIRVNDQYRVSFRFGDGRAHDVRCEDYH